MHASAPFVVTGDDHEVEDNYAGEHGGKTGDTPVERRIPFLERRRNAYNDIPGIPCPPPTDPGHTLLGRPQMTWLKDGLSASRAAWKVLASSVEIMGWDSSPGVALNRDGWDGYPADRRELAAHVLGNDIRDVTVLTGDVHHFAAGVVTTDGRVTGRPWATEFVGGSITSGSPVPGSIAEQSLRTNPHMVFQELDRRGYGVMEAGPDGLTVLYRSPASIEQRPSAVESIARFRVARGEPRVQRA